MLRLGSICVEGSEDLDSSNHGSQSVVVTTSNLDQSRQTMSEAAKSEK